MAQEVKRWLNKERQEALETALDYAICIIESYQMNIRNSHEIIGCDLVEKGFCQGTIYKYALRVIDKLKKGEIKNA